MPERYQGSLIPVPPRSKQEDEADDDASSQRRQLLAFTEKDEMKESFEHIPNPIGQVGLR
jgi:hypothetical protein